MQNNPSDSAKINRGERCEEEGLTNNLPFSVLGLERSRIGQMQLKWEGKGLFERQVLLLCLAHAPLGASVQRVGRNGEVGGVRTAY